MAPYGRAAKLEVDAFPRDALLALLGRLTGYARLAWRLARDPALGHGRRALLLAGAAYLASPIDLVPGIIPVAGQLDDAAAILLVLRNALEGLPPERREEHLRAAGLRPGDVETDLRTVGRTSGWLVRRGGRLARDGLAAVGLAGGRLLRSRGRRSQPSPERGRPDLP